MAIGSMRHGHSKGSIKMFSFRVVCRSIENHPFLVVVLLFLTLLHQYFPFLFSLLASASPVLICTAILLGTLLIHGQPNDCNDVKYHHHDEMSNTGVTLSSGIGECQPFSSSKEGIIYYKDRFAEVRNGIVAKGLRCSEMLNAENKGQGDVAQKLDWEYNNAKFSDGNKSHKQNSNDVHHKQADDSDDHQNDTTNHESSDCESDGADKSSFDALVADVIPTAQETRPLLDSEDPLHLDACHDDGSHNYEFQSLVSNHSSEDSGEDEKDGVIQEDEDAKAKDHNGDDLPNNAWMDMEKNQHLESLICRTNDEGDDDEEEEEELGDDGSIEDVDDDDDDDDEEEDNQEKETENTDEDASKQIITMWTEEDEKNMRLVGNSEFERDLRLENLLARRKARRNFSMISERNLKESLDSNNNPVSPLFQVAPISAMKVNPFDSPTVASNHQQHCNNNNPPVPGSAPSVRVPKKNPFDSPCTSPKETNSISDNFEVEEEVNVNNNNDVNSEMSQDNVERSRKDAIFRRYESFNPVYNNYLGEASREDSVETDQRDSALLLLLRRHESFNTRSVFPNNKLSSVSPKNVCGKMRPFFMPEHVVGGDQEVRHSSSSVSSSESDRSNTLAKHTNAEPSKVVSASIIADNGDPASNHCEDASSVSSDAMDTLHEDAENVDINSNEMHHNEDVDCDDHSRNDHTLGNTSGTAEEDHDFGNMGKYEDEDEDGVISEHGLSPKDSSNDTIESPVFDTSPSGTEKSTPFSSTDSK